MPGITDPTQPYFKDGGWGWDGTEWRKLALVWGFSDQYLDREVVTDAAAGDGSSLMATVPAGEVWTVTLFVGYSLQSNISMFGLQIYDGTDSYTLAIDTSPTANVLTEIKNPVYLVEGDQLKIFWKGATLNDDFRAYACGYKMKIAE